MGTALMNYSSGDYKHRIGNPKRNIAINPNHALFSYPSDNFLLASFLAGGHLSGRGLLSAPPSYPPAMSAFRQPQRPQQQPPLLPLPNSMPLNNHHKMNMITRTNSTPNNYNILSATRLNKNVKNRGRDHSLTPKKSKSQKKDSKKVETIIGPDPKDLPKDVISKVFANTNNSLCDDIISVDKFSGSVVFTPSPPPSSLPLPTFSFRPKVTSCSAEVAGVDAGATDSLRRLLRLR